MTAGVGGYPGHNGVDIQIRKAPGDPIFSIISGTVIEVNNNCSTTESWGCCGGFGNYVVVHGKYNGVDYVIMYAYMQLNTITVGYGQNVSSGQKIGQIGDSESSVDTTYILKC
ncbi:M23 family metallopeptidase [Culicoidibacter larvae]|uniref:M23 family metallopeptidase n=1 Tax=Culicoidibacter larvae TaxID=2579976 RepID=UPI00148591A1|nr:M23 family metallopeptidase [Culicoidibacter larvae]